MLSMALSMGVDFLRHSVHVVEVVFCLPTAKRSFQLLVAAAHAHILYSFTDRLFIRASLALCRLDGITAQVRFLGVL